MAFQEAWKTQRDAFVSFRRQLLALSAQVQTLAAFTPVPAVLSAGLDAEVDELMQLVDGIEQAIPEKEPAELGALYKQAIDKRQRCLQLYEALQRELEVFAKDHDDLNISLGDET
jgi:hypothetical protein